MTGLLAHVTADSHWAILAVVGWAVAAIVAFLKIEITKR